MTPKVQKKRKTANKQDSSSTFSSSSISASSSSSSSLQQEEQTVEETPVIASASEEASLSTQKSLDVYLTEQFNQGDDEEEEEEEVEMSSVLQHNSQEYNYNALSEYSEEESNSYYSLNGQSLTGSAGLSTAPTSSDSSPSVSPVLQTSSLHTSSFNFPQYQQTVVAPSSTSLWSSGYQQIQRVPSSVHSSPILRGSQLALHFMEDEEPETFPVSQPQQQQQEQQPQKQVEQPQKQVAKSPAIKSEKLVITFDEVHNSFPMENLKKRKTTSPPTIMEHSFHIHEVKIEKKDSSSSLSTSDDTEKLRTKKSQKNSLKEKPNKVFQCNFEGCGKIFKRAEHLKRHTRIHTGEKPYVCRYENCGKSFSRMDNLSQHVKVHSMKTTKDKLDDVEENGDIEFDSESSGGKDSPISME